jgi:NADP-dependent 3-hydroxy acid dehydrogenase YdfG
VTEQAEPLLEAGRVILASRHLDRTGQFVDTARAYCVALDVYDRASTPANLKALTLARVVMRDAFREEREPTS